MITLTKLNGDIFVLNSAHIEKVESIPDTKVVLVGGGYYLVKETPEEITDKVICYHAEILRRSRMDLNIKGEQMLEKSAF